MKLSEVHLIHPAPEPGNSGNVYQWYSAAKGYELELVKEGVVVSKASKVRIVPLSNVIAYEPAAK